MAWTDAAIAVAFAVGAYLIGSLPSAYLVGRYRSGLDIRTAGEGNVGARNAFHEVGKGWGVLVWALDVGKEPSSPSSSGTRTSGCWPSGSSS